MDIVTGLIMGAINGGGGGGSSSHGAGDVCTVIVDFRNSGINGSVTFDVCYARYDYDLGGLSIEGDTQHYGTDTQGRYYIPVCVPKENDEFKAYICFPDIYLGMDISVSGAATGPDLLKFLGSRNPKTWASLPVDGYWIQGDAEITISAP